MSAQLVVDDEVNCHFVGLEKTQINRIISRTKKTVSGSYFSIQYQMGNDDGKESQFFKNGSTFMYMLDSVLPIIDEWVLNSIL